MVFNAACQNLLFGVTRWAAKIYFVRFLWVDMVTMTNKMLGQMPNLRLYVLWKYDFLLMQRLVPRKQDVFSTLVLS